MRRNLLIGVAVVVALVAAVAVISAGKDSKRAGFAVATAMEVFVDEGTNTVLKLTAPPQEWPWQAHARGVVAHAVYGVALGLLLAAGAEDE